MQLLRNTVVVKIDQCFEQFRVTLLLWFKSIANELGSFFISEFLWFIFIWNPWLIFLERIEVGRIERVLQNWDVRSFFISKIINNVPNIFPINSSKKWMSHNLFYSIDSESNFRIINQFSNLHMLYLIKSAAYGLTSTSRGITKYFLQFWIFCQVILDYSEAKGGYPTNIS